MSMVAVLLLCIASRLISRNLASDEQLTTTPSTLRPPSLPTASICCPVDWSLIKITRGMFQPERYECRKLLPETESLESISVNSFQRTVPVYGYRIQPPEYAHEQDGNFSGRVPKCDQQTFHFINTDNLEIDLPSNACLTSVDQRLAAIYCPITSRNDVTTLQPLNVVHKCCPLYYVYDKAHKRCIRSSDGEESFQHYSDLLQQWTIFLDGEVQCDRDMVLVEYNNLVGNALKFIDGKIALAVGVEWLKFALKHYCVEAIVGKDADGDDDDHDVRSGGDGQQRFLVRTCQRRHVCQHLSCIRRCCADGEIFAKGNATSYCKRDETDIGFHSFESLQISGNFSKPSVFGILRGLDCQKFRLNPDLHNSDAHTINANDGSLYVPANAKNYSNGQYCVEKVHNATFGVQKLYSFLCFDAKVVGNDKIRFKMYPIGLLISCSFYAVTLGVYLSISRLRNLPGRILICLVVNLFAAYLGIALGQLIPTKNDGVCFVSGYFIYFCLMAAFAWMNVMCFDIWQTFGSAKNKRGFQSKETARFLLYSLYGWGLPTLMTIITISLAKSDLLSENLRPNFKEGRCWFTYGTLASANLLFFSGPIGVLSLINFVLFLLTLRYCNRVKREIFRMQSSNVEKPLLRRRFFMDKARFAMNTKLFIVMGITWFLELLSIVLYDRKKMFFWVVSDSFNVLLGVFVFFIFVFKKRIWHTILVKLGCRSKDSLRTLPPATYVTQSTYAAPSISMTRLNNIEGNLSLLCNAAKN